MITGSNISNVHKAYDPASDDDGEVKPSMGATFDIIATQIMMKPDLNPAGISTSARSMVLVMTSAMVVVAHDILRGRSSAQCGEQNATNADAKIISQVCDIQQIICTL